MVSTDFEFVIPHKTPEGTKAAIKYAAVLAEQRNIQIRLIDVQIVPRGLPLDNPVISLSVLERRLRTLARESTLRISTEVVFARNWEKGFRRVLTTASTVLLPMWRSCWGTSEKRFAARLRKAGYTVFWVECE
jgi:hypothetical protein